MWKTSFNRSLAVSFAVRSVAFIRPQTAKNSGAFFLVIALNKIRAKGSHHRAAKRDVRRTVNEGIAEPDEGSGFDPPSDDASAYLLLRLVVDEVLAAIPDTHRDVVRLRIEGYEIAEIAEKSGRSKRTVERILQEFRSKMAMRMGATDDDANDGRT